VQQHAKTIHMAQSAAARSRKQRGIEG